MRKTRKTKIQTIDIPNFSINVKIWDNAGMVDLINNTNKTKLTLEEFQPFGAALHQGRKIAEMLNISLTINDCPDDGRLGVSVIPKLIVSF